VFYHQYASGRELKNINHFLTIKMKHEESFKQYVGYFESQMALVYDCNDDVAAAAFISGMQVNHSFYNHVVKHEVTKMRGHSHRAQKYIQIEDVTQSSAKRSPSEGPSGETEGATWSFEEDSESGSRSCQQARSESRQGPQG